MLAQDPKQQFDELKGKLLSQIEETFPIQDRKGDVEVRVRDLHVKDDLGVDDIESQYKAKTKGQSWVAPIHGTLDVVDTKTGKVLSTREKVRVADVPKLTRHYSYIIGGQEKQVANQWRLKPGAYVKATEKEGEYEAQFQLSKGKSFDIKMDPESGYMHMAVGGRKVPLYSVLKQSGVTDDQMKKMWGASYKANLAKSKGAKDIRSLYRVSTGKDAPTDMPPDMMLKSVLENTKMDPEVTKDTLGKAFEQVTPDALVRASTKLVRVSDRRQTPDAIDSLKYKELWTAADQFVDRVAKGKWNIHRRVQNALGRKKIKEALLRGESAAIRDVVPTDAFRKPITHVFATSLARDPDQTNPIDMLSGRSLVTITGPGGIQNPNAITYSNTAIDPSQLGFLDPIHTPESEPGKNLHLTVGTEIKNRKPTLQLFNMKTGKIEKVTPQKAAHVTIALPDQVKWKKGRPVPIGKEVRVSDKKGEIRDVAFKDVQYVLPSAAQMFSVGSNLVPFMQNDSAHRSTMSARHMEQAISIDGREPPLVQVAAAKGKSFEELVGGGFLAHRSPVGGKVVKVDQKGVHIRGTDGKTRRVQLYDHYPLNDPKAMLHSEPLVKVGQTVRKNQIVADNNFTKNGKLALGTNLKTAYIANGANHEDGIVLSHTAATKMTSTHLSKPSMAVTDEHIVDKNKFVNWKGVVYDRKQLDKIGDEGVVRVGQVLEKDDPMILVLGKKQDPKSIDAKKLKQLGNKAREPFTNAALTWDKEHNGEVVAVHNRGKEIVVHVKTKEPAVVGSKISTRHSAKGIVAEILPDKEMPYTIDKKTGKRVPMEMLINPVCYDEETEFLTKRGWVFGRDLCVDDIFATMNSENFYIEWQKASRIVKEPYKGKMYRVENQQIDLLVTPKHRMFTAPRVKGPGGTLGSVGFDTMDPEHWTDDTAEGVFGQPRRYLKAGEWAGHDPEWFTIDSGEKLTTGMPAVGFRVESLLWAEFMGWFLAEGHTYFNASSYSYTVGISQSLSVNPEKYARIQMLLQAMELQASRHKDGFTVRHKGLYELLAPLGGCDDKYIPREILDLPRTHLAVFLAAFVQGDGNTRWEPEHSRYGTKRLSSNSKQLVDGLQEICIKLGYAANIKEDPRHKKYRSEHHYVMSFGSRCKAPWMNWSKEAQKNQIEEWVDYEGRVYCCTVPNGFVVVRRRGKPVVSGQSVPGRMNPGQILETVMGKIAEKTGKPIKVKNFEAGTDYLKMVRGELKKHGISETEELHNPKTGRKLGEVTVGPHYALQLKHQIDKKSSVRGGYGYLKQAGMSKIYYDNNAIPRGGGTTGAQSLGSLGNYGALAAGLRDNLREMQTHKSDQPQAENVWGALNRGELLPPPQVPFVHDKFKALFQSMGVNMVKEGHQIRLMPRTDRETLELSRGEIKKPNMAVKAKNMKEEKDGLFDPHLTGGKGGQHWSHIKLSDKMPNPVYAKSIALLLGIKERQIPDIISGDASLPDGSTGVESLFNALKKIDVNKEHAAVKVRLDDPKLRKSDLDKTHGRFKALGMLKENKMRADQAYMMRHVPVLPPQFRPMSELPGGKVHIDPMNQLYRRLGMQNRAVKDGRKEGIPREAQRKDIAGIYKELQGLFGTTPKSKKSMDIDHAGRETEKRPLRGVIHSLSGESPKDSFFQNKMIGKKQDFTARATIVADPGLGMDEIGIPKKVAFELFRPMVANRIHRTGKNLIDANKEVSNRSRLAEAMLRKELEERPVLVKRDPVLHQYGIIGQRVKLIDSPAVKMSPMVLPPMNADVDGDQVAIMVPLSREARDEVKKVMPSSRPLSASSGDVMFTPTNESALALYRSTLKRGKKRVHFMDLKAAESSFKKNKIELNSVVKIGKHETTLGRARIAQVVPEEYRHGLLTELDKPFTKTQMSKILKEVARNKPKHFEQVATGLTQLGFKMAYESGHSVTLKDLDPLRATRGKILGAAQRKVNKLKTDAERTAVWKDATGKIREAYDQYYEKHPTNISDMAKAKVKAKPLQFQGLVMAPMLVQDHLGRPSKVPIKRSFAEGLDLGGYWLQSSGARRGVIQKVDAVREPGYMTKLLVRANIDQAISDHDCETTSGLLMKTNNKDCIDRHLSSSVKIKGAVLPAGTVVTPELVQQMGAAKIDKIPVRSPLKCRMPQGVCAKCMGLHPTGKHYDRGDAVGVVAAQALGERATQIMLRETHGGGILPIKKSTTDEFKEVQDLFYMKDRTPENAAVAQKAGKVTRIVKMPQGGHQIYHSYSKKPLFSRHVPNSTVKVGYQFKQGEQLTGGDPNVHDLIKSRGLDAVQGHLVDRIGKIYSGEGVLQRHVELAVRNATGLHRIDDPGDHPSFVRGDYVMKPLLDSVNRKVLKGKNPIVATPTLRSIITAPQYAQKDWMARLNTEDLGKHILIGAQHGQRADLHGSHPIPGLAYGKEFARGPEGRKGY